MNENGNILGKLFPTQNDLMKHFTEFGTLTDEQIMERASNGVGIDTEQALTLTLERDFCKGAIDNIISKLLEIKNS